MKSKIIAIFAVFMMVATCLAIIDFDSSETKAAESDPIPIDDSRLTGTTYWVKVAKGTGEYTLTYNPNGNLCDLDLTAANDTNGYNVRIDTDFTIPAGCTMTDSSGRTNYAGTQSGKILLNIGYLPNPRVYVTVTLEGKMEGVCITALYGVLDIKGNGSFNDKYSGDQNEHIESIFLRPNTEGSGIGSVVKISENGSIESGNIVSRNGSKSTDDKNKTQLIVNNLVAGDSNNGLVTISCNTRSQFVISGNLKFTQVSDMILKYSNNDSTSPGTPAITFNEVKYENLRYFDIQNFNGNITINGDFEDLNTTFIFNPNVDLTEKIVIPTGQKSSILLKYVNDLGGAYSEPQYYGGYFDDGTKVSVTFVNVVCTKGISSITFDPSVIRSDNVLPVRIGGTIDPTKITVTCDEGYTFAGWYYADDNGVLTKINDLSTMPITENMTLYAQATQIIPTPEPTPEPAQPEEVNYTLIAVMLAIFSVITIAICAAMKSNYY